jgi:hypothetical protein
MNNSRTPPAPLGVYREFVRKTGVSPADVAVGVA